MTRSGLIALLTCVLLWIVLSALLITFHVVIPDPVASLSG